MIRATVVGAGLAGAEAAWQLAERGVCVTLLEQKPLRRSAAHHSDELCELVCSNSLKAEKIDSAPGLLKEEMRRMDSLILRAAGETRVPAGGALAVDRDAFSGAITGALTSHPRVEVRAEVVTRVPEPPVIVATGPLTDVELAEDVARLTGEQLWFYDAAAPIVMAGSVDFGTAFHASRWSEGDADYVNCPMSKEQYLAFREALLTAEKAEVHSFEDSRVFEACLPIEVLAARGENTLRYGPLKPVGIRHPDTGERYYAVVQLRAEDAARARLNLVGFQTRLKFPEQKRVFSMIPGLKRAQFARFGVMHRNTYMRSPGLLTSEFEMRTRPGVYFAGQMTGVEGYVESAASGLIAGRALARALLGQPASLFPPHTMLGALGAYVSAPNDNFQPMHASMGLLPPIPARRMGKKLRYEEYSRRSLEWYDKRCSDC